MPLAALALLCACGARGTTGTTTVQAAATGPKLTGPTTVVPGSTVRFLATGFRPGSNVEVVLTPADRGTCCSIRIARSFHVGTAGSAIIAFKMPPAYRRCDVWLNCTKIAWRQHEVAVFTASGYLQQAAARATVASVGPG